MAKVEIKGLYRVTAKGRTYWYAWRGGPRLHGEPGTREFLESYQEAVAARSGLDRTRMRWLVSNYRGSEYYLGLADSTRQQWATWLDEVADHFGKLRIVQFGRPEKIKPVIRRWRNQWASTPRKADYGMQVLSRVLSHAVDPLGLIASNPCEGIKQLYAGDRSEIIWTDAEIAQLKAVASPEICHAVDLAAHTGLRRGDLLRLAWSHVGEHAIVVPTSKSGRRREAVVPLYTELRDVLARIPKRSTTALTSSRGTPWTSDGFGASFNKAKHAAGLADADLHFHDLRGTAATRFYLAGIPERAIAEIMGWEEDYVSRIIRRYVGRQAATMDLIRRLEKDRNGNG